MTNTQERSKKRKVIVSAIASCQEALQQTVAAEGQALFEAYQRIDELEAEVRRLEEENRGLRAVKKDQKS